MAWGPDNTEGFINFLIGVGVIFVIWFIVWLIRRTFKKNKEEPGNEVLENENQ
jgi:hypothetical protein